jgi:hypothetical protein
MAWPLTTRDYGHLCKRRRGRGAEHCLQDVDLNGIPSHLLRYSRAANSIRLSAHQNHETRPSHLNPQLRAWDSPDCPGLGAVCTAEDEDDDGHSAANYDARLGRDTSRNTQVLRRFPGRPHGREGFEQPGLLARRAGVCQRLAGFFAGGNAQTSCNRIRTNFNSDEAFCFLLTCLPL